MHRSKVYGQDISLKDLCFHILYRWRSLLLAALIGAVIMGGNQYLTLNRIHGEGKLTKEEREFELNYRVYWDSLNTAKKSIETYEKQLAQIAEYEANSVWIQLDPNEVWVAKNTYYVQAESALTSQSGEKVDLSLSVMQMYATLLLDNLDAEQTKNLLGTSEKRYVQELVQVDVSEKTHLLTLEIQGSSQEQVAQAMEYFDSRLTGVCREKAEAVQTHTLTSISEEVYSKQDDTTTDKKDSEKKERHLNVQKQELNDRQREYQGEIQKNQELIDSLETKGEPVEPGTHILRFTVTGFLLGFLALAFLYTVLYLTGGRIHSPADVSDRFGLPLFGNLYHSRARHPGKGIDGWLEKLETRHVQRDDAKVWENVAALAKEQTGGAELLLTGTVPQETLAKVKEKLSSMMPDTEIRTEGSFNDNAEAITASGSGGKVLLVEEKYTSRLRDLERAVDVLLINEADVEGCIVL